MPLESAGLSDCLTESTLKALAKVYGFKNRSDIYDLPIDSRSQIEPDGFLDRSLQQFLTTRCAHYSSHFGLTPDNELRLIDELSTALTTFLNKYPNIDIILDKDGRFELQTLLKLASNSR